ncbi:MULTISPECIES: AAA family ATPase [unclassified Pseudomonas]|uniref:AAA family ATPase n=1 Tax=unclassified Pseudomonas TaxID=196821 RepID=UPI001A9D903B|nr:MULTISPECIES: AAA family ATPase [unclassified Pseudomonas]MDP4571976.1 AAA family ATPase [Pseudomonas sp. LPH60]
MSPDRTVIHVLFFADKPGQPVVLPLTDDYEVAFEKTSPITDQPSYCLQIARRSTPAVSAELSVASFTTLYGENGSGKTAMLLELCEGLVNWSNDSNISVLWEDRTGLHLAKGTSLQGVELQAGEVMKELNRSAMPDFFTAFYTTSPFERARLNRLKARGVKNLSTQAWQARQSDPIAAFSAYPYLKGRADFVSKTQVNITVKPISLVEALRTYGRRGTRTYSDLQPELKSYMKELDRSASLATKFILSFTLLRAADRFYEHQRHELIDALVTMIRENQPWLDDHLTSNLEQLNLLSNDPLLMELLFEAQQALEVVAKLFDGLRQWNRRASLSYLNRQIGRQIRRHEGLLSEVAALGLLELSFEALSCGQASMMSLYCSVAKAIGEFELQSEASSLVLCLDEAELFMHPKWQSLYVHDLLEFIQQFASVAKRTHLFISTHSLLVVADTPANRLFDLDCKRLDNAFGYTAKQTLTKVFKVDSFTGSCNAQRLSELSRLLNRGRLDSQQMNRALSITKTLASETLQSHVMDQLLVLGMKSDAQV